MGPICRIDGSGVKCYGVHDGLPDFFPVHLAVGDSEDLWVGGYWGNGYSELVRWRPGSPPLDVRRGDKHIEGVSALNAIGAGKAGSLWLAIEDPRAQLSLDHFQAGKWTSQTFPDIPVNNTDVTSLFVDRDDSLWIATAHEGIFRVRGWPSRTLRQCGRPLQRRSRAILSGRRGKRLGGNIGRGSTTSAISPLPAIRWAKVLSAAGAGAVVALATAMCGSQTSRPWIICAITVVGDSPWKWLTRTKCHHPL